MTRVIFAGGGTGGHLYPGLAIARALVRARGSIEPFFIGALRGIERDVLPATEFPHLLLDLHPLYRSAVWNNWKTAVGAVTSWRRIGALTSQERPAVVVGTGGYAAGIMLAYSVVHGIPIVQQIGDSYPGLTARAFSRWTREAYLNFPEAARVLKAHHEGSLIDTGAPIESPPSPLPDRRAAREHWGFPPEGGRVLLVYGGSQGSLAINRAVAEWVQRGLPDDVFLIWGTGRTTHDQFKSLDGGRVRLRPYLSPIADAYAAADLAISRAGAMTTAELFAWRIPAVLIPLPTAAADHQTTNAVTLERAGAAIHIPQSQLSVDRLEQVVGRLLESPDELARLSAGAAARARPNAAADIAERILVLIDTAAAV
jgi:UDP-N-acetylglucosamine:LPS N-acetylglucosamine transferase